MAERRSLPKRIKDAPQLCLGLELYFEAFMELHTCRGGLGCDGPIPWTAVDAYCNRYGLRGDRADDMLYYIRAMDDAWLEHNRKKQEAERKRSGKAV